MAHHRNSESKPTPAQTSDAGGESGIFPPVLSCPRCHSSHCTLFLGMYGGRLYQCKICGYIGPLVIEWRDSLMTEHLPEAGDLSPPEPVSTPAWVRLSACVFILCVLLVMA
ncbi:MAG: hypothetical protein ACP5C4_06935 [Methanomicrobiales archaeon]